MERASGGASEPRLGPSFRVIYKQPPIRVGLGQDCLEAGSQACGLLLTWSKGPFISLPLGSGEGREKQGSSAPGSAEMGCLNLALAGLESPHSGALGPPLTPCVTLAKGSVSFF